MVRCHGVKINGKRCNRSTSDGRCFQHACQTYRYGEDAFAFNVIDQLLLISYGYTIRNIENKSKNNSIQFNRYKLSELNALLSNSLTSEPKECPVCYESDELYILDCKHDICSKCVDGCNKKCPVCRSEFDNKFEIVNKIACLFESYQNVQKTSTSVTNHR